jgi:methionyl-tRNA synthetase
LPTRLTTGRVEIDRRSECFRHKIHQDNGTRSPPGCSTCLGTRQTFFTLHTAHTSPEKNLLKEKGLINKGKHSGWYSVTDECFYSDAQVAEAAPTSDPLGSRFVSIETGSQVEWTKEENYMFSLTSFRDQLFEHIKSNPDYVYPPARYQELVHFFDSYMQDDLSISRPKSRLSWGVPVPDDPEHTMYVWFEALISYLTAIGYPSTVAANGVTAAWPPDLQVMGKDILR